MPRTLNRIRILVQNVLNGKPLNCVRTEQKKTHHTNLLYTTLLGKTSIVLTRAVRILNLTHTIKLVWKFVLDSSLCLFLYLKNFEVQSQPNMIFFIWNNLNWIETLVWTHDPLFERLWVKPLGHHGLFIEKNYCVVWLPFVFLCMFTWVRRCIYLRPWRKFESEKPYLWKNIEHGPKMR